MMVMMGDHNGRPRRETTEVGTDDEDDVGDHAWETNGTTRCAQKETVNTTTDDEDDDGDDGDDSNGDDDDEDDDGNSGDDDDFMISPPRKRTDVRKGCCHRMIKMQSQATSVARLSRDYAKI